MTIRAVFFDMGGTIETYSFTRELRLRAVPGFRECLARAGIEVSLDDNALLDVINSGMARYHQWRLQTHQELPTHRILGEYILADFPVNQDALQNYSEEIMCYYDSCFYQRQMRPEAPAVLEAVRQMGLKIGLISNISSKGMVPFQLKKYGILEYFHPLVLSSVYGRRKPDPALFHYAARLANVPTSQCLYIGDRIARDISGARRAGYGMAVQIIHDFKHGENDDGAAPDAVIHRLTELLDILNDRATGAEPPAPGKINALLFDAGDILYFRPERGKKLEAFLKDLYLDNVGNYLAQKEALHDLAFQGQITQDQFRERVLRLFGVTQPDLIEEGKVILEEEDNDVCFFEGVRETLAALKAKGYLLGIITDTANPVYIKLNWFEKGGFGSVWDTIISSQEMGVRKPDPEIYQAALSQLGLTARQAVFVGHKSSELEGARAVGMKTIAFNYDEEAKADYYIKCFADLLDVDI